MVTAHPTPRQRLLDVVDGASVIVPLGLRAHRARAGGLIALRDGAPGDGSRDAATAPQDAEGQLRQAVALYTEWGALPYRARALAELGFVLAREGRDTEAQPLLDEAYLTSVGARTWLDELDLALVETH